MPLDRKKKAGIIAAAVVLAVAVVIVGLGAYVRGVSKVYPHVLAGGVDLGGLTCEEAEKALTNAGYENKNDQIYVELTFPDKEVLKVSGKDAGLTLNAADTAKQAAGYGKSGSFLGDEFTYIKQLLAHTELDPAQTARIDEDHVRSAVSEFVNQYNEKLLKNDYETKDGNLTLVKGAKSATADAEKVYGVIKTSLFQSLSGCAPVKTDYKADPNGQADVDLSAIYNAVHVDPVDAVYDTGTKKVTQSVEGVSFDLDNAKKLYDAAKTGATVVIPLVYTKPDMTTEKLTGLLFRDVLAEKSTYISGSSNRVNNIKLAAQAVNGTILNPGDTFSFNGTVGQRTTAKGYKEAGAYVSGQTVQEVGGGICQVSSTLYYCTLYADLQIVERSNHMFTVGYLPLGLDATVSWGSVDFKFKNNTEYPIKIESSTSGGYLTVRLHGTKTTSNTIKMEYTVVQTIDYNVVKKEDASVGAGKTKVDTSGHNGYVVDTYKKLYDVNGNLISTTLVARNTYKAEDEILLVSPGTTPTPGQTETMGTPTPTPTPSPSQSAAETPSP